MSNEEKILAIMQLIINKTMPKEQLGFYTESDLFNEVSEIINK